MEAARATNANSPCQCTLLRLVWSSSSASRPNGSWSVHVVPKAASPLSLTTHVGMMAAGHSPDTDYLKYQESTHPEFRNNLEKLGDGRSLGPRVKIRKEPEIGEVSPLSTCTLSFDQVGSKVWGGRSSEHRCEIGILRYASLPQSTGRGHGHKRRGY